MRKTKYTARKRSFLKWKSFAFLFSANAGSILSPSGRQIWDFHPRFVCFYIILSFLGLFFFPSISLSDQTEQSFKKIISNVEEFELSNGLRVLLYTRPQAPVFAAQIWIKVGGVDELTGHTGAAHLFEHMAFKGTKTIGTKDYAKEKPLLDKLEYLMLLDPKSRPDDFEEQIAKIREALSEIWRDNEFSRIYQRSGAVGLNAATGKDYTYYTVALPSVAFELWSWMESDRLLNPIFRQFYKERDVVMEERRMRIDDNPNGKVYEALLATSYWAHPYRLPIIGWASDLENLTATQVSEFYKKYYRPDNMLISLVGDLKREEVEPVLEKYFSRLPVSKEALPSIKIVEPKQQGPREAYVKFDAKPSFVMAYHKPTYPNPDDAHFAILHSILAGDRTSVFHKEFVQERQLANYVYTSEAPGDRYPSLFYVGAEPTKKTTSNELKDEIQKTIDRFKTEEVSEEELAAAIKKVKVSFLGAMGDNGGLARLLAHSEIVYGDWRSVFELYETAFQTNADDLKRLASKYLNLENRTYVYRDFEKN